MIYHAMKLHALASQALPIPDCGQFRVYTVGIHESK